MQKQVAAILQRELQRLDELSQDKGLDLSGFKALELLIKAHQTFAGKPSTEVEDKAKATAVSQSTEDLLKALNGK